MRNSSPWSNSVFEKEVIFHQFDFETSYLEFEVSISSIWKHTTSCDKGFFLYYYLATLTTDWAQIFTSFVILCIMLKYNEWEDWFLTITSVFNQTFHLFLTWTQKIDFDVKNIMPEINLDVAIFFKKILRDSHVFLNFLEG